MKLLLNGRGENIGGGSYRSVKFLSQRLRVVKVYRFWEDSFVFVIREHFYGKKNTLNLQEFPLVIEVDKILREGFYELEAKTEWRLRIEDLKKVQMDYEWIDLWTGRPYYRIRYSLDGYKVDERLDLEELR